MQGWFAGGGFRVTGQKNIQGNKPRFDISQDKQKCEGIFCKYLERVAIEETEDEEIRDEAI